MSSGGGSSPTPNRICTGSITTNQRLWLVSEKYSLTGANWQKTPITQVQPGTTELFVANGETPNGQVTYQTQDGTQFILVFTMNGSNTANILGNGGAAPAYNYSKNYPTTGDTMTVSYTLSNA
ncbi:hypothetical protein NUH87_29430 [Pseudomonas batumici]|uniref:hypothetical protein n=1 Tax=Pseudomonas batumici TaxID=226910 RepID=UPI0030CED820